jgi:RNA polymerase sigma-70 factor, ECF subfamily
MMEDPEARLRRIASQHLPAVAAYLRHRMYPLGAADLDDLLEECLVVTWRRLDDCPVDAERAWLIGVARNVLKNARRSHRRRSRLAALLRPDDPSASPEMWVLASALVRESMAQLTEADRDILMMHHWEGLRSRDIALILGLTQKAAEARLTRAQGRLRHAIERGAGTACYADTRQCVERGVGDGIDTERP